jgi:outer membrane protein assembly factor BamB
VWHTDGRGPVDDLLVAGDTVYATRPTETVALDAAIGARRWTTAGDDQSMVPASRRLACLSGERLYTVDSERVRAFDARDGSRLWSRDVTGELGEPVRGYGLQVADSTLVFGYHGGLAGFDVGDGTQRWQLSPGGLGWVYPAVAHGRLYVGSPGPLYAYERPSGVERVLDPEPVTAWQGNGPVFCTWPAVGEHRIVVADHERSVDGMATTVWAYGRRGALDWRCSVPGVGRAPAVTPGGTVVVSAGEEPSTVLAIDRDSADGAVRWRRELSPYVREPIVAGDVVLVAGAPDELARNERVRALDVETGEQLWSVEVDGRAERLAAVGDWVYVGTDTGRVVALA